MKKLTCTQIEKLFLPLADQAKKDGWGIFFHTTAWEYRVEKMDEAGILETDEEASELARKAGLDVDEFGRILGKRVGV